MNNNFVPKINCRFKIREDQDYYIGFFQGKGVLTFNEIGAFIVMQMTGEKSLKDIELLVRETFHEVENPSEEVQNISEQFRKSHFF